MSLLYPISHLSLFFGSDFVILEVCEFLLILHVKCYTS